MNNIFKNAKFGKPYKTRDGRKAIFYMRTDFGASLLTERYGLEHYHFDGVIFNCIDERDNIVSEWQEEINEEELVRLSKQEQIRLVSDNGINMLSQRNKRHAYLLNIYKLMGLMYKAGYRKAKEGGEDD